MAPPWDLSSGPVTAPRLAACMHRNHLHRVVSEAAPGLGPARPSASHRGDACMDSADAWSPCRHMHTCLIAYVVGAMDGVSDGLEVGPCEGAVVGKLCGGDGGGSSGDEAASKGACIIIATSPISVSYTHLTLPTKA